MRALAAAEQTWLRRKPVRREELTARIEIHTTVKQDASWMKGLVSGATNDDTEAMSLLKAIMPERIISKIQVSHGRAGPNRIPLLNKPTACSQEVCSRSTVLEVCWHADALENPRPA